MLYSSYSIYILCHFTLTSLPYRAIVTHQTYVTPCRFNTFAADRMVAPVVNTSSNNTTPAPDANDLRSTEKTPSIFLSLASLFFMATCGTVRFARHSISVLIGICKPACVERRFTITFP